jgi:hypothetical protein
MEDPAPPRGADGSVWQLPKEAYAVLFPILNILLSSQVVTPHPDLVPAAQAITVVELCPVNCDEKALF